jgi:tricarballylate dehydrogenase
VTETQGSSAGATVVVVGSGAAGLSAALAAAEVAGGAMPACRVVLIERAEKGVHGGNTRWSPSYMRMAAPDRVAPGFEADVRAASGGRTDEAYVRRLAADAPAAIAWLERYGVTFHKPVYYLSEGPPRIQPVGGGIAILERLQEAALRAGVAIRYGVAAERLVVGGDGAIAGIEVRSGAGGRERIAARAVVLACGGFAGNREMLAQHLGEGAASLKPIAPGTAFNTGDGIRMALEAGAQAGGDWSGMHAEPVDPRSRGPAPVVLVYPYGIVVDRSGRRFFDEGGGLVHETWERLARAIHFETPGRMAYAILDAKLHDIAGWERAVRSEVPPWQAASIAQLAELLDVPAGALQETIAGYNAAATGDPGRFDAARADGLESAPGLSMPKSNWCRALDRPPYLAWPLVGAIAYTFGGVATNAEAEVLGAGGPIRGLYAAGEITGHFHGTAPNAVAMLRALVFGRAAGSGAVAGLAGPGTAAGMAP